MSNLLEVRDLSIRFATPGGHIDLPRARKGGFAGGMFAIFPPPVEKSKRSAVPPAPSDNEPLPPELPQAEAITSTIGMASILFRLERAGALTVCRSAGDVRDAMAKGSIAAVFHIEGVEAIDPGLAMLDVLHAAGLLSEDIDPATGELWGNYPQTYSLVGIINCAVLLSKPWSVMR